MATTGGYVLMPANCGNVFAIFGVYLKVVFFFRKCDVFFSLPKKCAENYPEKDILKLRSVKSQLTLIALQCLRAGKFKIQCLG